MSASDAPAHGRRASYVSGTSDLPLIGMTIGDCLDAAASECPEREALVSCHQNLRYTYAELRAEADRIARGLMALGVERGDRVGIWSLNCAEWAITQLAAAKLGAILVNLNPSYRAHELKHALTQSGLSTLVLQGAYRVSGTIKSHYVDILCEIAPELRDPPNAGDRLLACAALPRLKHVICLDETLATPGMWCWPELHTLAANVPAERLATRQAELQFDDPINIQYTSGNTGAPKGVTLTHHNILNNGYFVGGGMNLQPGERVVIPVPLYHCFGMVMGTTWRVFPTALPRSTPTTVSTPKPRCAPWKPNGPRRSMACRRCSSPSWSIRASPSSIFPACAPASWPVPTAPSK